MTHAYFDNVANEWDQMRSGFFPESLKRIAADAADVRASGRYLDVGAGTGFLTGEILARGGSVAAIDASPRMIEGLRARFPAIAARVGDAEALPYEAASFDAALANMCLHHVERPAVAIREMARVVKPGGRVVIADLDAHAHEFLRTEHHDRWMGFDRAAIAIWMREAGLVDVRVEDAKSDCCAESACGTERAEISIFLATGLRR